MDKSGISTHVLDTYVADFHGTSVVLFEQETPDADINKPVCFDCHGVHDIASADDPQKGLQVRQNLLVRCQACHPDATDNFPDSWMSHYIPSLEKNPLVYFVDLFYKIIIPVVIGGMAILVVMDAGRAGLNRYRRRKSEGTSEADIETPEEEIVSGSDVQASGQDDVEAGDG
jgi:hypothetical protein